MASINEAVFEELVEKGESIVNDLGGSIRSLLKYSDIHFVNTYLRLIFIKSSFSHLNRV